MSEPGYFLITARVNPALWARFNDWYTREHMPDAVRRMGAREGMRLHDREEACVHVAIYRFDDAAVFDTVAFRTAMQALVAEYLYQ